MIDVSKVPFENAQKANYLQLIYIKPEYKNNIINSNDVEYKIMEYFYILIDYFNLTNNENIITPIINNKLKDFLFNGYNKQNYKSNEYFFFLNKKIEKEKSFYSNSTLASKLYNIINQICRLNPELFSEIKNNSKGTIKGLSTKRKTLVFNLLCNKIEIYGFQTVENDPFIHKIEKNQTIFFTKKVVKDELVVDLWRKKIYNKKPEIKEGSFISYSNYLLEYVQKLELTPYQQILDFCNHYGTENTYGSFRKK